MHIDHLRNFFIIISNHRKENKNFMLQTLDDKYLDIPLLVRQCKWVNLLSTEEKDPLIIEDFNCFSTFIAIYVRENNKPKIIIQDLDSQEFHVVEVNGGDIGEISPMLNQEYEQDDLRF